MSNTPLYILGSSGHAREIASYAKASLPGRRVLFVDDSAARDDCVTVTNYYSLVEKDGGESIIGAGRCDVRRRMAQEIRPPYATIIHPSAVQLGDVGSGCVIAPGAVIAPGTVIEGHVLVNYNATIGHDTRVQSLSVIGPGSAIGGWCHLEEAVYVGAGALIRERLVIGKDAIIGMGAVVTRDVPADVIAKGVPACIQHKTESGGGWIG